MTQQITAAGIPGCRAPAVGLDGTAAAVLPPLAPHTGGRQFHGPHAHGPHRPASLPRGPGKVHTREHGQTRTATTSGTEVELAGKAGNAL